MRPITSLLMSESITTLIVMLQYITPGREDPATSLFPVDKMDPPKAEV